jgi:hypothetical protein
LVPYGYDEFTFGDIPPRRSLTSRLGEAAACRHASVGFQSMKYRAPPSRGLKIFGRKVAFRAKTSWRFSALWSHYLQMFSLTIVAAVLVALSIILRVIKTSPVDAEEGRDGHERAEDREDRWYPLTPIKQQ